MLVNPLSFAGLVSIGITAAAAGQAHVASPGGPVNIKMRQTNREQVVRRQHSKAAEKFAKRAVPSITPSFSRACGTPFSEFFLQFVDSGYGRETENKYGAIVVQNTTSSHYLGLVDSLMEATKFTFDATCGLTNAASGRTADISFEADAAGNTAVFFSGVFFDTEKERSEFNTTLGECTVSGAALSCAFGVATEFSVCYGGTYYYLATERPGDIPTGCRKTAIQLVGAP